LLILVRISWHSRLMWAILIWLKLGLKGQRQQKDCQVRSC
jgi:hypothetical protein